MKSRLSRSLAILGLFLTGAWQAQASPFRVEISDLSVTESYQRDPQTGSYEMTSQKLQSRHEVEDGKPETEKSSAEWSWDAGPDSTRSVVLFRQGQVSELHVYISPNGSAIPSRTRWMLELREGSWEDFEQGRTIKAEIVAKARDPKPSGLATEEEIIQKSKEEPSNYSKALLDEVAQYYYFHHYIYWLKDQNKTPTTEPIINVEGLKPTKVILSKDQFGIRFEAEKISIEVDVEESNKPFELPLEPNQKR